jgi:phosphomannomutase
MTLIKSISGIRGTIGGEPGNNLTPIDIVKFTAAFARMLKDSDTGSAERLSVVLARDARVSGDMVRNLVTGTLQGMGIDVIDLGLASTPTTEMAVIKYKADGGVILTASHNPAQWNALKLLNSSGEFISDEQGKTLLSIAEIEDFIFVNYEQLGKYRTSDSSTKEHINAILQLPYVDVNAIRKARFSVAIDCVNSVGGIALPELLESLGVKKIHKLYCDPSGLFPHNPEPLPEHLTEISNLIREKKADLGFVVDPDVDRLAIVCEDGSMFGEEYTLVATADYILSVKQGGNTVSNLSSTQALRDITQMYGGTYEASAVGEVNVVEKMKATRAVIGGEGNGGVILPDLHYGRDALVGIALFLSHLARLNISCTKLKSKYPFYVISKNKIALEAGTDVDLILKRVKEKFTNQPINDIDGIKIHFGDEWVHLRKSNTEPIIRIYAESRNRDKAEALAKQIRDVIGQLK